MGLAIASTRFLARARRDGVRFDRTLTLGRQHVAVSPERIEKILREFGSWPPPAGSDEFHRRMADPAARFETLARALGAQTVDALDASTYEGAGLVHDLNQPIPREWEERYDVVLDGGTLEHVFNFPVAIANCMKLVKPKGHLILLTPANNYFGHGFYQFSPELFYRALSSENGFKVERMSVAGEAEGISTLLGVEYLFPIEFPEYDVADPAEIRKRVTLINDKGALLFVRARRLAVQPIFSQTPQQSDYLGQWSRGKPTPTLQMNQRENQIVRWLRRTFAESFCREILPRIAGIADPFRQVRFRANQSVRNKEFFTRTKD